MKFRLQPAYLVCGFFVAATLLACLGEWRCRQTFDHALGRTLVIATTHGPASLHPVFGSSGLADVEIMGALFEPLTVNDDRRRLAPCLALEVPSFDNGGLR